MSEDDQHEDETLIRPGDVWPGHFRGSKYRVNADGTVWWQLPVGLGRVQAVSGHEVVAQAVLQHRPEGGTFRITEQGEILVKREFTPLSWTPVYVDDAVEPLEFEGIDVLGDGLEPFDLWTGFYDGAKYSFSGDRVWWRDPETHLVHFTREPLPDAIRQRLQQRKPLGGSLRITENGKVLTLIPPQPVAPNLKKQFDRLSNEQRNLLVVKTERTQMLPVYVGDFHGGFTVHPPRRITDPLTEEDQAALISFLKKYDSSPGQPDQVPTFDDDWAEDRE